MKTYEEIYLVDDDDLTNTVNTLLLKKLGMEDKVRSFVNPELALDTLRFRDKQETRTLILLDINMPEMTGFEFVEFMKLEKFPVTNEVVMVTSSDSEEDREEARKYKKYIREFITKPLKTVDIEDFLQKNYSK